jgi:glutaconate CoA-transferase subunit A
VQGFYDRDAEFYLQWDKLSRGQAETSAWLDEWVHGVSGRAEYVDKLGPARLEGLRPGEAWSGEVNYGRYL